jgi:hypothetical protein
MPTAPSSACMKPSTLSVTQCTEKWLDMIANLTLRLWLVGVEQVELVAHCCRTSRERRATSSTGLDCMRSGELSLRPYTLTKRMRLEFK